MCFHVREQPLNWFSPPLNPRLESSLPHFPKKAHLAACQTPGAQNPVVVIVAVDHDPVLLVHALHDEFRPLGWRISVSIRPGPTGRRRAQLGIQP